MFKEQLSESEIIKITSHLMSQICGLKSMTSKYLDIYKIYILYSNNALQKCLSNLILVKPCLDSNDSIHEQIDDDNNQ